ncbi:MAG: hypothetical protein Q9175_006969 [Cornicularia normoerica]
MSGPALSATLPKASQVKDNSTYSPLKLIVPGNVSAAMTNTSYLNPVPDLDLFSLNDAFQHPSNHSASINGLSFGYDLPAVTNAIPQCNGAVYGTNLDRHSCFDAWGSMGFTAQLVSWGPRGPGHNFQFRLPYRWSSDDGQCVIDVVHRQDHNSDFASFLEIRHAADQVMQKCIDPPSNPAMGGFVANVGKHGRLVVVVSKYTPNVRCGQDFQAPQSRPPCRDTLSALPVSMRPVGFGRQGLPGVQWPLPWTSPARFAKRVLHPNQAHPDAQLRWISRNLPKEKLSAGLIYGLPRLQLMLVSGMPASFSVKVDRILYPEMDHSASFSLRHIRQFESFD